MYVTASQTIESKVQTHTDLYQQKRLKLPWF